MENENTVMAISTDQGKLHISSARVVAHCVKKKRQQPPLFFTVRHSSDKTIVTFEAFIANAPLLRYLDTLDMHRYFEEGYEESWYYMGVPLQLYIFT
jgi:hypothetical protein